MTTCPRCAASDIVRLELAPAGQPVRFASCRACEHRWWQHEHTGEVLVLRDVLDRIAAA